MGLATFDYYSWTTSTCNGPIAYLIAGRNKPKGRKAPKRGIVPPDDDPDFLGKL